MPVDFHLNERFRKVQRIAACEFAESNGKTRYDYVRLDSLVIEPIGNERIRSEANGNQREMSYDVVLTKVLTSQKLWDGSRRLRWAALRVTSVEAEIRFTTTQSWCWSIGHKTKTGVAIDLKKAQVAALQAILVINPCLRSLARLAGLSLPKER